MASWVITMSSDYPQHWEIAKRHGFWDMPSRHLIQRGDDVYFWLAGGSFLGQARASSDALQVTSGDALPWEDADGRVYTTRFTFQLVSDSPLAEPTWGDVRKRLTKPRLSLQAPRRFDDQGDERVLASYFHPTQAQRTGSVLEDRIAGLVVSYSDEERRQDLANFDHDLRRFTSRAIAMREGQPQFRQALLAAYNGACAITGTSALQVLEAAHISPYKGGQSNETRNGLLLRTDIHTLFDRHLITVLPDWTVRVSPELRGTDYERYEGRSLVMVPPSIARPNTGLLEQHNADCHWLTA